MTVSMPSTSVANHLDKTTSSYRSNTMYQAEIIRLESVSPTTKLLTLHVSDKDFNYKAGQWLDFFIPFESVIGGFSFCSSPHSLKDSQQFQLLIKYSTHSPAQWIHKQCKVGHRVMVRVGGDFHYPSPSVPENSDLLLIAGGVGISPIMSMYEYAASRTPPNATVTTTNNVVLLYSASTNEELIFQDKIRQITSHHADNFRHRFHITKSNGTKPGTTAGRITADQVMEALAHVRRETLHCFLCGPTDMIDGMITILQDAGVSETHIHYEKWW